MASRSTLWTPAWPLILLAVFTLLIIWLVVRPDLTGPSPAGERPSSTAIISQDSKIHIEGGSWSGDDRMPGETSASSSLSRRAALLTGDVECIGVGPLGNALVLALPLAVLDRSITLSATDAYGRFCIELGTARSHGVVLLAIESRCIGVPQLTWIPRSASNFAKVKLFTWPLGPVVHGLVQDQKGDPVPGATVGVSSYSTVTGVDGRYSMRVSTVRGRVKVAARRGSESSDPVTLLMDRSDAEIQCDLTLSPRVSVNGLVVDPVNRPIANASITELHSGVRSECDEQGRFRLEGLHPDRPVHCVATAPGRSRGSSRHVSARFAPSPLIIALSPARRVIGRVLDCWGSPASSALIMGSALGAAGLLTDADGMFTIEAAPMSDFLITVRAIDGYTSEFAWPADSDVLELKLSPICKVWGRVVSFNGGEVHGAEVVVYRENQKSPFASTMSGPDGTFETASVGHGCRLAVHRAGHQSISIQIEQEGDVGDLVLSPTKLNQLWIRDSRGELVRRFWMRLASPDPAFPDFFPKDLADWCQVLAPAAGPWSLHTDDAWGDFVVEVRTDSNECGKSPVITSGSRASTATTVQLSKPQSTDVLVLDSTNGKGIAAASLASWSVATSSGSRIETLSRPSWSGMADGEGRAQLPLFCHPGKVLIVASAEGFVDMRQVIDGPQMSAGIVFRMIPRQTASGVVLAAGRPLGMASVRIEWETGPPERLIADKDGRIQIDGSGGQIRSVAVWDERGSAEFPLYEQRSTGSLEDHFGSEGILDVATGHGSLFVSARGDGKPVHPGTYVELSGVGGVRRCLPLLADGVEFQSLPGGNYWLMAKSRWRDGLEAMPVQITLGDSAGTHREVHLPIR